MTATKSVLLVSNTKKRLSLNEVTKNERTLTYQIAIATSFKEAVSGCFYYTLR